MLHAYTQLAAEGWLTATQGSVTRVGTSAAASPGTAGAREPAPRRWRFDLRPGRPDPTSFPRDAWVRALRRALQTAPGDVFGVGDPQGQPTLRAELAGYLNRARGLRTSPDRLLVTTGYTQGLSILVRSLTRRPGVVAMEVPGLAQHRQVVRAAGRRTVLVGVDGGGMRVGELSATGPVALVVVTPHRQHPTGATLAAPRRAQLLALARGTGALVLEDDYDGEFRYDHPPLGALQSLDPDRVVYAGTISKTLAPAVRLGWLVLPKGAMGAVMRQKAVLDGPTGALEQLAFAEMLRSGEYDRHVRRMRLVYRRRRDLVVEALRGARPDLRVLGSESGLHLLLPLAGPAEEAALLGAAERAGLGVEGLLSGGYFESGGQAGLVVGFGACPEHRFARALRELTRVLGAAA